MLGFNEKEDSTGQGVDLKDQSVEEVAVDKVVIVPADDVIASLHQEVNCFVLLVQVVGSPVKSVVLLQDALLGLSQALVL